MIIYPRNPDEMVQFFEEIEQMSRRAFEAWLKERKPNVPQG